MLDLSAKSGIAKGSSAITSSAGLVEGLFSENERSGANVYMVLVDTTAGDVNLTNLPLPSTLSFLARGDKIVFIKSTSDSNRILFDDSAAGNGTTSTADGYSGLSLGFVNQKGEAMSLTPTTNMTRWGVYY